MTPIPLPLVDGVLYMDNSAMELLTTCPRQSYYYTIRKLELNRDRIALEFGDRFHDVLRELYVRHNGAYRSTEENSALIDFAAAKSLPTPEDDYRTTAYLVQAVQKYLTDYPAEPFEVALINGRPAVEVPFMLPLCTIDSPVFGRITVIWTGKIDLIYRRDGRIGIMDHKTTSMMGPQFFAEFDISSQFYGYKSATEYILGQPVEEITINGLGCRKPTATGKKFEYNRHIIHPTAELSDEWHHDTIAHLQSFITHAEQGYFPKATKWCVNKYGPCQYRSICTLDPSMRESALNTTEFKRVTWNPLASHEPVKT